jgi:hypothetical protein
MPTPKTPTPEQLANIEAARAAHDRGEIVQFRSRDSKEGRPIDWAIYEEPFTWWEGYEYRTAPRVNNAPYRVMPEMPASKQNCIQCLHIVDADGNLVVRVSDCPHTSATTLQRAYADHIVRCVNASDKLVAALKFYANPENWDYPGTPGNSPAAHLDDGDTAREALKDL